MALNMIIYAVILCLDCFECAYNSRLSLMDIHVLCFVRIQMKLEKLQAGGRETVSCEVAVEFSCLGSICYIFNDELTSANTLDALITLFHP